MQDSQVSISLLFRLVGVLIGATTISSQVAAQAESPDRLVNSMCGTTVLMEAAEEGSHERVRELLRQGADPTLSDLELGGSASCHPMGALAWPERAVGKAARLGHGRVVEELLLAGSDPNEAMSWAIVGNEASALAVALKHGAELGRFDLLPDDCTLLTVAAMYGNVEMTQLLLQAGADPNSPNATDCGPESASNAATNGGFRSDAESFSDRLQLGEVLSDYEGDVISLMFSEHVVRNGTALVWAAALGETEIVRLLLAAGADSTAATSRGDTALDWARRGSHDDVVVLLEDAPP